MTPWKHAESSVKRWGGLPTDYIKLHDWFDETKAYTGDWTHRALRHHSAGIQWAIERFGHVIVNSKGQSRFRPRCWRNSMLRRIVGLFLRLRII